MLGVSERGGGNAERTEDLMGNAQSRPDRAASSGPRAQGGRRRRNRSQHPVIRQPLCTVIPQ
jgi:hypothetical protein